MRSNSLGYPYTCKWGLGSFKYICIYRWYKFYTLARSRYWFLRLIHTEFLGHVAWSTEGNWTVWWITLRKRCQSHISSCKIAAKSIWSIEIFSEVTWSQAMFLFKGNLQKLHSTHCVFSPNMSSTQESSFNSSPSPSVDRNNWISNSFMILLMLQKNTIPNHLKWILLKPFSEKIMGCQFTFPSTGWVEIPDFWLLINVVSFSLPPHPCGQPVWNQYVAALAGVDDLWKKWV